MLDLAPLENSSDNGVRPRRRLNPQLVKEMEQKHHRDRIRNPRDNDEHHRPSHRRQRRMSGTHATEAVGQRYNRGANSPRKHKRGSSCHSI